MPARPAKLRHTTPSDRPITLLLQRRQVSIPAYLPSYTWYIRQPSVHLNAVDAQQFTLRRSRPVSSRTIQKGNEHWKEKRGFPLTQRKGEITPMICPHVNIKPARSWDLFQFSRRPRRPSEIIEPSDDFQHCCESDAAGVAAEAGMWAHAVVNVGV